VLFSTTRQLFRATAVETLSVFPPWLGPLSQDLSGLQGNLNSRNWRMPLCSFGVGRDCDRESRISFIRRFRDRHVPQQTSEILNLLSDRRHEEDCSSSWHHPHRECAMPPNMMYDLSGFAVSPMDLPPTPTFRSESGHKIWIREGFNIQYL
jgi:hypothetical protein